MLSLTAIAAFSYTPIGVSVANVITATSNIHGACFDQVAKLHTNANRTESTSIKADLNDDGSDDHIITLTDTASCGTSGCITELCIADNGTATLIPFGYATNEVRVLETRNANYFDLMINEAITVSFDGTRYVPVE